MRTNEDHVGTPADVRHGRTTGPALLVLGAASLWGTAGTAQVLGAAADPVAVGAARLAVGGAALVALYAALGARAHAAGGAPEPGAARGVGLVTCLRRPVLGWTLAAGVAAALYQGAFFAAVATTGVATGTVVALGVAPVATGVCAAWTFGERLGPRWGVATALAIAGCVVLVTTGSSGSGAVRSAGVALAVIAGACYGVYTTAAKALLARGVGTVAAMAATLGAGAVLCAPVVLARAASLTAPSTLLAVAWLGLVTTAGGYLLFARGLRVLPAATVGTLSLAEPLLAAVLGVLVLQERPGPWAAAGALTLLAGLTVAATSRPRPPGARDSEASRAADRARASAPGVSAAPAAAVSDRARGAS